MEKSQIYEIETTRRQRHYERQTKKAPDQKRENEKAIQASKPSQMNCHARSRQNRQKLGKKMAAGKPPAQPKARPNGKRKPASHVWKAGRRPKVREVRQKNNNVKIVE